MNGSKILLDTNAFIYFFEGRSKITNLVVNTPEIYFSVISEIELLSTPHLTQSEIDSIKTFLTLCHRVEIATEIIDQTISIRRQYRIKIPDAIIAASALQLEAALVTADMDFQKVIGLSIISDIID